MTPKDRKELIRRMERIIGNSCYNGNIQNYGPGGEWEGEGRQFRYPINFIGQDQRKIKLKHVDPKMGKAMLLTGYYAFGANSLNVMRALDSIVTILEEEYSIQKPVD